MNSDKKPEAVQDDQTVYVLEGEPDEVYDAQGNPIKVTPEEEKEIEDQI